MSDNLLYIIGGIIAFLIILAGIKLMFRMVVILLLVGAAFYYFQNEGGKTVPAQTPSNTVQDKNI